MHHRGEVLVAILNHPFDLQLVRDERWYRIPVRSVEKWLSGRWPPKQLAFYQPKIFVNEAFSVRYYAPVLDVRRATRRELFPDEPSGEKSTRQYYQLILGTLQQLPRPIFSRRFRRIVFIPTTWTKFVSAGEINDLYDESPLEDRLWAEFKRYGISAERQEYLEIKGRNYALDFAIYCHKGKLDVETDGDTWHADPKRIPEDNLRDNDLETAGWKLLRFNTRHIHEHLAEYCLPTIVENINNLGGPDEGRLVPRHIRLNPASEQLGLFDDPPKESDR